MEQSRPSLALWGFDLSTLWNSSGIKARIERIEREVKLCYELFFVSALVPCPFDLKTAL